MTDERTWTRQMHHENLTHALQDVVNALQAKTNRAGEFLVAVQREGAEALGGSAIGINTVDRMTSLLNTSDIIGAIESAINAAMQLGGVPTAHPEVTR